MIKMQNCAAGETPTFAAILAENAGLSDVLFEPWEPADSNEFRVKHFPPFVWDEEEGSDQPASDPTLESEAPVERPEYLGVSVHMLRDRQAQSA